MGGSPYGGFIEFLSGFGLDFFNYDIDFLDIAEAGMKLSCYSDSVFAVLGFDSARIVGVVLDGDFKLLCHGDSPLV